MLAENLAWKKQNCTQAAWRMLRDLWPELRLVKWFRLDNVEAMGDWPWAVVMRRRDMTFGDLLFAGHPKLKHILIHWEQPRTAVHASSSKGFSLTNLKPYWWPRISLIVRPPY